MLSGVLQVAHGPGMRTSGPATLAAGAKLELPAGTPHSVSTRGVTLIEIESTGPFGITYLNQADDPRKTGTRVAAAAGPPPDQRQRPRRKSRGRQANPPVAQSPAPSLRAAAWAATIRSACRTSGALV